VLLLGGQHSWLAMLLMVAMISRRGHEQHGLHVTCQGWRSSTSNALSWRLTRPHMPATCLAVLRTRGWRACVWCVVIAHRHHVCAACLHGGVHACGVGSSHTGTTCALHACMGACMRVVCGHRTQAPRVRCMPAGGLGGAGGLGLGTPQTAGQGFPGATPSPAPSFAGGC